MKPIKNYEGLYAINPFGDIRSMDRNVKGIDGATYPKKGKQLSPSINAQTGYLQVDLWRENKGKRFYVHRLVAETYIPNPDSKPEVNHKDGNRTNCAVTNLEWVTSSENSFHAYQIGMATQVHRRKLQDTDYPIIFNRFITGESFATILQNFDISPGRLSVNLRAWVKKVGKEAEYSAEKYRQQVIRAMKNGSH